MLATMLNQLDNVLSPSEEPFLLYFKPKYGKVTLWNNELKKQFLDDFVLMHERNFELYFYNYNDALENLYALEKDMTYLEFCKAFYFQFLKGKEKSMVDTIVDKQLKYPFYIDQVQNISPDSKFIFLVRDPRDNVMTCIKRKLGRHLNIAYQASYWNNYFENVTLERLHQKDKFMLVKYEDIVHAPEKHLSQICTFLNIKYNENMLAFHDSFSNFIKEHEPDVDKQFMHQLKDFHSGLQRPLDSSKIGVWKKEDKKTIQLIEKITGPLASKLGYEIEKSSYKLSLSEKYWIWLGTLQKKWTLKLYLQIPFRIKIFIKRIRKPARKE